MASETDLLYAERAAKGQAEGVMKATSLLVVVIGGPTASGKSALALALAERLRGTVINADSMQVYRDLHILTARPGPDEEARAPHRLYGVVPAAERMSVARWRDLALAEIRASASGGRLPIVVGGSGLYLRGLMEGLAAIPPVPTEIRAEALALQREIGTPALHTRLAEVDPGTAARLATADTTRVVRAWEVWRATGRPLSAWQRDGGEGPPADLRFRTLVVEPPRSRLYAACDVRFRTMMESGALEEVRSLARLALDPNLPAMKALGVPELLAVLQGGIDPGTAIARAQQATRNYAKRQTTWFRNQMPDAARLDPGGISDMAALQKFYDNLSAEISSFISFGVDRTKACD